MKKIREKTKIKMQKAKEKAKKLKKEVKKAMYTAIVAAFGFLIALVWRDFLKEWVDKISAASPVQGQLISTLIVTFICVIGILLATKFFFEE